MLYDTFQLMYLDLMSLCLSMPPMPVVTCEIPSINMHFTPYITPYVCRSRWITYTRSMEFWTLDLDLDTDLVSRYLDLTDLNLQIQVWVCTG